MSHPAKEDVAFVERLSLGRAEYVRTPEEFSILAPGARNRVWILAAVFYGVPWIVTTIAVSVWYLGWGFPESPGLRLMLWVMTLVLTFALHTLAVLSLWGAVYSRSGTELLTIDSKRITVVRRAGTMPLELHISRSVSEEVKLLQQRPGVVARPRIEVRSWRSAIRFGAGLTEQEAVACADVLTQYFERAESERGAR